jgi:hypothetical protein
MVAAAQGATVARSYCSIFFSLFFFFFPLMAVLTNISSHTKLKSEN